MSNNPPNKSRNEGIKNKSGPGRGNSFQNGGKDRPYNSGAGNGRGSQPKGPAKKTSAPPVRPSDNPKPVPLQAPPPENVLGQKQPNLVAPIPSGSGSPNQESLPASVARPNPVPNVAQPQPTATHAQIKSFTAIPPRTHSAPPNLQEQEKQQSALFFPEKTPTIMPQFKTPYFGFYNQYPIQPMGIPPNMPMQPGFPLAPNPPPNLSRPKSKALAIIDPETNQEVVIGSPPKTSPVIPATNKQPPPRNQIPGGIMLELSNLDNSTPSHPPVVPITPVAPRPLIISDPPDEGETKKSTAGKSSEKTPERSPAETPKEVDTKNIRKESVQVTESKTPPAQTHEKPKENEKVAPKETHQQQHQVQQEQIETEEDDEENEEGGEESVPGGEDFTSVAPPKKKNLKEVLKNAEGGNYRAFTFDAYSNTPPPESSDKQSSSKVSPSNSVTSEPPSQSEEEEEDNWESKDEVELMKLRTASPMSLGTVEESKALPTINIKTEMIYPEGVWSPNNRTGKMTYDRSFLLQFQGLCTERPANLPDMSELVEGAEPKDTKGGEKWQRNQPGAGARGGFRDGRPPRAGPPELSRSSGPPPGFSPLGSRNAARGAPLQNPPGGRGRLKKGQRQNSIPEITLVATPGRWEPGNRAKEIDHHKLVLKAVTGVLNKLTMEKFDPLSDEIINVGVINEEILKDIIKAVFDKALTEPKFSSMYADLCKKLSASSNFTLDEKAQTFKRILLNRCQEEFESSFKGSKKIVPETSSPEERAILEEQLMLEKKKMLGNITFIGELYKVGMLTEKIMHECITKLLGDIKNPSHDDIEALCRLMTSIGAKIDHQKAKNYLDQYFVRMKELSRNKTLPSRIRFMLQDVIELRVQKWVITKDNNSLNVSKGSESKSGTPSAPRAREEKRPAPPISIASKTSSHAPPIRNSGEWEEVKSSKRGSQRFAQDDVRLQPSFLGPNMGSSLSQGAKGWKAESSPPPMDSSKPISKPTPVESKPSAAPTVNLEELESKTDLLLKEYLSCADVAEAIMCIKELNTPSYYPDVVNRAILMGLEKGPEEREMISKVFLAMQEEGFMTPEIFQRGVDLVLDIIEDLMIDIPHTPTAIGTFVANAITDEYFPMSFLESLFRRFVEPTGEIQAADLVAEVFLSIGEQSSISKGRDLIRKSKVDIMNLLPQRQRNTKDLIKFLEEKELQDFFPHITYGSTVENMFKDRASGQAILKWMEDNMSSDVLEDATFSRHFVRWVLQAVLALNSSPKDIEAREQQIFKDFAPALKYVLPAVSQQQGCLYEVQLLGPTFPRGQTERIFEYLYSFEIITPEVFILWAEDEGVVEGKKEAIEQTRRFFDKLRQSIDAE